MRYTIVMRIVACSFLVLLQLLICTIGQGALTLCVRRDGSQRLEWTLASECHAMQSPIAKPSACGHVHEQTARANTDAPAWHGDPCTDYLLKAEPVITLAGRYGDHFDPMQLLLSAVPVIMLTDASVVVLQFRPPPLDASPPCRCFILRC